MSSIVILDIVPGHSMGKAHTVTLSLRPLQQSAQATSHFGRYYYV